MIKLRSRRETLGLSQSNLARISGVSRFKICMFELGGGALSTEEQLRVRKALEGEAARLRSVAVEFDFHEIDLAGGK